MTLRTITRALISVSDKTGLEPLAQFLKRFPIEILSTGGTARALRDAGLQVKDISDYTGFPEILDGRVKTLHPRVHGGLLGCPDNPEHSQALTAHKIPPIELVIVNLYPFEATVKKGASFHECIENIDIGGPSMIRSAAKNHDYTTVITDPADYETLIKEMEEQEGATSAAFRTKMAAKAFARTASYDSAISNWFASTEKEDFPETLAITAKRTQLLRYGENPHQKAAVYVRDPHGLSIATAEQLQGKELSYNNINDADAALELVSEFHDPAVAIIKHANPCGVAVGSNLHDAYTKALASDPVSAFGGIIAVNKILDAKTAEALSALFLEVVVAPDADMEARQILAAKKNLRLLLTHKMPNPHSDSFLIKAITGGFLLQSRDTLTTEQSDLQIVTKRKPTQKEMNDLLFAFTVCKHVKSNAIVLAKEQATIGIGAGQMSRVDSVHIATLKAKEGKGNENRPQGAVIASDAFFPFADGLLLAAKAGITAAIQPGGSIRDEEVIKAADEHDIAMVFTGHRHFRH